MSEDALAHIHKRLDSQDAVLTRIEKSLTGDPQFGHTGIAQRLSSVENKLDAHDKKLILWGGIVTGASLAMGELKRKLLG